MFGLGPVEMLIVGVIAVLLFGNRLPEVGRSLGKGLIEFKKGLRDIQSEVNLADTAASSPSRVSHHNPIDETGRSDGPQVCAPHARTGRNQDGRGQHAGKHQRVSLLLRSGLLRSPHAARFCRDQPAVGARQRSLVGRRNFAFATAQPTVGVRQRSLDGGSPVALLTFIATWLADRDATVIARLSRDTGAGPAGPAAVHSLGTGRPARLLAGAGGRHCNSVGDDRALVVVGSEPVKPISRGGVERHRKSNADQEGDGSLAD